WIFAPILILYGVVYACNTAAWWLIMADEPVRPPFWRAYAITVAGFSLNFVTPMVNVGGEPFKIAAAARWLGVRRAAGSVVFYHRRPGRFFQALLLEYLSRSIFMLEYVLIGLGVGLHITYLQAYAIGGLTSLIQNAIFFVPFEVGTKEGSLYVFFQLLGLDPALGVYTAIVSRLRDMAWIGVG